MRLGEIWVRAVTIVLLTVGLGLAIGAAAQHNAWTLAVAGIMVLAGVGFATLSLHERTGE